MANPLKYLVIHCTATPEGREVTPDEVRRWHMQGNGWDRVGYRILIGLDGTIHRLHPTNDNLVVEPWEATWGVGPRINPFAHHICYVGGCDQKMHAKDTRTKAQMKALESIVNWYVDNVPGIKICGHHQVTTPPYAKACPSFDVPIWLKSIGTPTENIYPNP